MGQVSSLPHVVSNVERNTLPYRTFVKPCAQTDTKGGTVDCIDVTSSYGTVGPAGNPGIAHPHSQNGLMTGIHSRVVGEPGGFFANGTRTLVPGSADPARGVASADQTLGAITVNFN